MKNFSKKYLNTLVLTRKKEKFSFYEREELVAKLNKIVEELKFKEQEFKKELDEFMNDPDEFPIKFKHLMIALAASVGLGIGGQIVGKFMPESEAYRVIDMIANTATSILIPPSFAVGLTEFSNKFFTKYYQKRLKEINSHKSYIKNLQFVYKPYIPMTATALETPIPEEELCR